MTGCVISLLLFFMPMKLILLCIADIAKIKVTTKEQMVLPPFRTFMDDITILIPFKVGTDELLQRYHKLFTWEKQAGAYN